MDWLPSNNINIDTGQTLLLLLTLFQHTAPCQVSQAVTRQCNDPVSEGDVSFEMVFSSGAYNLSWSSRILTNIWRRMSTSFSNSFDSEIVLLGGGQRPGKHSRVAAITSGDQGEEDQDLQIQDSVSVRTFSSISQMSSKEHFMPWFPDKHHHISYLIKITDEDKAALIPNVHQKANVNNLSRTHPASSAVFSASTSIVRKRKISKVKGKSKTQKDELAEAVIKGDLTKIEDIIDVLNMLHGRGFSVVLSYHYNYNPDRDVVDFHEDSDNKSGEKSADSKYISSLNIINLACIFDQGQVIDFLAMYGVNQIKQRSQNF